MKSKSTISVELAILGNMQFWTHRSEYCTLFFKSVITDTTAKSQKTNAPAK